MALKVCKFGGSSLADAAQFRKVAAIVVADPERRIVVPSAPGRRHETDDKVTDLLYTCHRLAADGQDFRPTFDTVAQRFRDIACGLELDVPLDTWLDHAADQILHEAQKGHGPDYAASRGEAINGRLLATLLDARYVDAADVIMFQPGSNTADLPATQRRVEALLAQDNRRLVVPGFYGSEPGGRVRTFSRGGSDVTGALLARTAQAEVYENWTDVPGLLVTDPRVVPEALPIETVTYRELRELSYSGATVLHEEAVFPVRDAGIPVHVRNTNHPEAPARGLWLRPTASWPGSASPASRAEAASPLSHSKKP